MAPHRVPGIETGDVAKPPHGETSEPLPVVNLLNVDGDRVPVCPVIGNADDVRDLTAPAGHRSGSMIDSTVGRFLQAWRMGPLGYSR